MIKNSFITLFIFLLFSGNCFAAPPAIAAVVNGVNVNAAAVEDLVKQAIESGNKDTPELRQQIIDGVVTREVLVQQAYKLNLDKGEDAQRGLDQVKRNYLIKSLLNDYMKKNPVSDADVRAAYDERSKLVSKNAMKEYKLFSILVATEAEAAAIIVRLKNKESFDKVAKEKSIGPTKEKGGALGWVLPGAILPALSSAMVTMPKGTFSKSPVRSRVGWHVLYLEDVMSFSMPQFDSVKQALRSSVIEKRKAEYILKLKQSSSVVVN
jgi:peptidyl-prolyl cis-trans isomerase C